MKRRISFAARKAIEEKAAKKATARPVGEQIADYKRGLSLFVERQRESFTDVTDSEFWCALCFRSRAHKEAFLRAVGHDIDDSDKYVDGHELASRLSIALPDVEPFRRPKGSSQRLNALVADELTE